MGTTLYLMFGLPGAGKTTTAQIISKLTGAIHLWADEQRKTRFSTPKFDAAENESIYEQLNDETAILLGQGKSVVFDTAFNHLKDRDHLRNIASQHRANTVVIWVQTPSEVARERATKDSHLQETRILGDMTHEHFDKLKDKLEHPADYENAIVLNGTKITPEYVKTKLSL
jgi:predicted kinase